MELKKLEDLNGVCNYCEGICEKDWVNSRVCEKCGRIIVEQSDLEGSPKAVVWAEHIRHEVILYLSDIVLFMKTEVDKKEDRSFNRDDMAYVETLIGTALESKSAASWIRYLKYPTKTKVAKFFHRSALDMKMVRFRLWDMDRALQGR